MSLSLPPPASKHRRILLVEDEPDLREQVKFLLEGEGYSVEAAEDGLRALELLEAFRPELIVADVRMPRMDGFELCAAVRARKEHRGTPFVFLTARESKEDRLRGRSLGADDYLTKPFDVDELLGVIETRLKRTEDLKGDVEERFTRRVAQSLSHELKTPLTVIQGVAGILQSDQEIDCEMRARLLGLMLENGEVLNRHVDKLIHLKDASAAGSSITGVRVPVELEPMIEELASAFEPAAKRKGLRLSTEVEKSVGAVAAQRGGLIVLLGNLIENAVKFTPAGGSVRICARRDGAHVEFRIVDNGIGIAPDHLPLLFREFYREEQAAHTLPGTGLGLALCRRIVDMHAGTISVSSEKDAGTTVTVRLPSGEPPTS